MNEINENPIATIKSDGGYTAIFRTIGFIGDSLSSGEHESLTNGVKAFHDYYEYSWGQFIARTCGLKAYNFSKGGLTAKSFFDLARYQSVFDKCNKCQAYVIALGVNDVSHMDEIYPDGFGTMDDVDWNNEENNKQSFVGYYVKIIQKLRQTEPKCRIFVVTPPTESPESDSKKKGYDMIADLLRSLPSHFKFLYTIDLRKYAPVYDEEFGKKYFCGGHMSAVGYKFTADMISTYIDYIIRNNIQDFTQVGFIGRDDDLHNEKEVW